MDITIGEAELEIMKVLWKAGVAVNSQYINSEVSERGWKRTTVATFLTRLCEKGAVKAEKMGSVYYYEALLSKAEYRKSQTKSLIRNLFDGSARELAAALFDEGLSHDDIEQLRKIFDEKEEQP